MSLPFRERRLLRGIERGLGCSDPRLASMMAFFDRLAADEGMPRHERGPLAIVRMCSVMAAIAAAVFRVVARVMGACVHTLTASGQWTGPYGSHDGRWPPPLARMPWYWYR